MAYHTSKERFNRLVEQALQTLPEEHMQRLTNISVTVEDYPGVEDARTAGVPRDELLGLFTGVPYPQKGGFFDIPPPLPDAIVLFKRNIEEICDTEDELVEEIRQTIVHEVGHYFGFSEEDLEEYE